MQMHRWQWFKTVVDIDVDVDVVKWRAQAKASMPASYIAKYNY